MSQNPYEPPQTETKQPGPQQRKLGENGGCALWVAVVLTVCTLLGAFGMWSERNTGAREAYMFEMFFHATCFFGLLSLIAYLLLFYYRSRDR